MADYNEITDAMVDGESPVTVSLMKALRDNPIAIAEGNSTVKIQSGAIAAGAVTAGKLGAGAVTAGKIGTGAVQEGNIAGASVSQGKLKTAAATASASIPAGSGDMVEFNVNTDYAFFPRVFTSGGTYNASLAQGANNNSARLQIYFFNNDVSARTISALARYVTASPPYDLGDGIVHAFCYARVVDGQIKGISYSDDPPWAFVGPHAVKPDFTKDGKKYKRVPKLPCSLVEAQSDPRKMAQYAAALRAGEHEIVEIDLAYKNRDMHLKPKPMMNGPGEVVLLDPMSPVLGQLKQILDEGEARIGELLIDGYVELTGEVQRHAPPGVKVMGIRWRNHG